MAKNMLSVKIAKIKAFSKQQQDKIWETRLLLGETISFRRLSTSDSNMLTIIEKSERCAKAITEFRSKNKAEPEKLLKV